MRVKSTSKAGSVAGALAGALAEGEEVTLEAIGVGANYQVIKSLIIARSFLEKNNLKPVTEIYTAKKHLGEKDVTSITYTVRGIER